MTINLSLFYNIVANELSRLKCTNTEEDKNDLPTKKTQELYVNTQIQNIQADFPSKKKEPIRVEQ